MNHYPDKIQSIREDRYPSSIFDHRFQTRKIKTSYPSMNDAIAKQESELLRICQALLLSTSMLLLSYHSLRHGRTEYSILKNGEISQGYVNTAVVTLSFGYSIPYSVSSFLAIGMLAYSLVTKRPRWSLPSMVLYLIDVVYDVSSAIIVVWLLFANLPVSTALSYAIGTIILLIGEIWIWMGVLRLYEQRSFK